jgi:hypothetical protein
MESSVLASLTLVFLVAGITLWLTSQALARRARRYQVGMQTLLQLASQSLEPLDIPHAAWPALHTAGWQSLVWSGNWYGQAVQGSAGQAWSPAVNKTAVQTFELTSGDEVHLTVRLLHEAPRGEQRLFATHLAQVFLLLLETRLRERTGALAVALAERARLSLYLQHDMRNMTQWVSWVSADFAGAQDPQALLAAAQRLKDNAPLAQERAQRLNAALGKAPHADVAAAMDLRQALEQAARLAGLELPVVGEATGWIAPGALSRALDNVLFQLASDWREGRAGQPHAALESGASVCTVTLWCPLPANGMGVAPEKLFEPFASGRPGGLGLGLYQARKSLREAGGGLAASVVGKQLCFVLQLPLPLGPPSGGAIISEASTSSAPV